MEKFKRWKVTSQIGAYKNKVMGNNRTAKNEKMIYSNSQLDKIERRIEHFKNEISNKWKAKNLSVLVSPVFPSAVFKREDSHYMD